MSKPKKKAKKVKKTVQEAVKHKVDTKAILKNMGEVEVLNAQVKIDQLAFGAVIRFFGALSNTDKSDSEVQAHLDEARDMVERALMVGEPHILWIKRMKHLLTSAKAALKSDIENNEDVRRLRFAVKQLGG